MVVLKYFWLVELIKSSLGPHGMAQLRGDKLQQNGYEKTEVVNRQKIGLKLCRRNEHEAVINLRDHLFIYLQQSYNYKAVDSDSLVYLWIFVHVTKQSTWVNRKRYLFRDCPAYLVNCLFKFLNDVVWSFSRWPCGADETLKGYPAYLSLFSLVTPERSVS